MVYDGCGFPLRLNNVVDFLSIQLDVILFRFSFIIWLFVNLGAEVLADMDMLSGDAMVKRCSISFLLVRFFDF
jgi:hypothetical protein